MAFPVKIFIDIKAKKFVVFDSFNSLAVDYNFKRGWRLKRSSVCGKNHKFSFVDIDRKFIDTKPVT